MRSEALRAWGLQVRGGVRCIRLRPLLTVHNATGVLLEACLSTGGGPAGTEGRVVEEECFENQRYMPLRGWSAESLLPTDCQRWSTRSGAVDAETLPEFCARARLGLPGGWDWLSDWAVDIREDGSDAQGWTYEQATEFFEYPFPKGSGTAGPLDFVRRRRWVRRRGRRSGPSTALPPLPPGACIPLPAGASSADMRLQIRPMRGATAAAADSSVRLAELVW